MTEAEEALIHMTAEYLKRLRLNVSIRPEDAPVTSDIDLGVRQYLGVSGSPQINSLMRPLQDTETSLGADSPLIISGDRFECRYMILRLPQQPETPGRQVLIAGPYLTERISLTHIRQMLETDSLPASLLTWFAQYYSTLPVLPGEDILESYLLSLGHALYKEPDLKLYYREVPGGPERIRQEVGQISETRYPDAVRELLQLRYDKEEEMMNAVAAGNAQAAIAIEGSPYFRSMETRAPSKLRDQKNRLVIMNTLCRKGAQRSGVHPVYLDDLSRRMAVRIEAAVSLAELDQLSREMLRKYCFLVQSFDTRSFTPTIRKAVRYIDVHYADPDLSLQSLASALNLNKCYLASAFRKETGSTVTAYINEARIRRACLRLNTSALTIGEIAAAVGIPNVNYFTRLFKKQKNVTPSEYRKMIQS
ncbi:MAG: AraC family transcriptional regulator [Lachnospiraceae bacterium]|nr:AraC family transcriptional regulator [Lachnospiraceae bacterium]